MQNETKLKRKFNWYAWAEWEMKMKQKMGCICYEKWIKLKVFGWNEKFNNNDDDNDQLNKLFHQQKKIDRCNWSGLGVQLTLNKFLKLLKIPLIGFMCNLFG